jgi:hypothetical protein
LELAPVDVVAPELVAPELVAPELVVAAAAAAVLELELLLLDPHPAIAAAHSAIISSATVTRRRSFQATPNRCTLIRSPSPH